MIRDVFLDIDDTLLDFHRAEAEALRTTLLQMGLDPTEQVLCRYSQINLSQWKLLEEKKITRERLLVRRFELLFEEIGLCADADRTQWIYERELGKRSYFLPGARELLDCLKAEGYRLYLASNGTTVVQEPRIKSAALDRWCQGIFLSEALGCDKPQKAFFDVCFASIPDFCPARAIILGDSLSSDIAGGINAGIKTCWFNSKGQTLKGEIRPDYEIRTLEEFPPLLKQL